MAAKVSAMLVTPLGGVQSTTPIDACEVLCVTTAIHQGRQKPRCHVSEVFDARSMKVNLLIIQPFATYPTQDNTRQNESADVPFPGAPTARSATCPGTTTA